MHTPLSTHSPNIKAISVLNLTMVDGNGRTKLEQYVVLKDFNYHNMLIDIKSTEFFTGKDVQERFVEHLISKEIIAPMEGYSLDFGQANRPCRLMQESLRTYYNPDHETLIQVSKRISEWRGVFIGPAAELHVCSADKTGDAMMGIRIVLHGQGNCSSECKLVVYGTGDIYGNFMHEFSEKMGKIILDEFHGYDIRLDIEFKEPALL